MLTAYWQTAESPDQDGAVEGRDAEHVATASAESSGQEGLAGGELRLVPDAADSLGEVAEAVHESTLGQFIEDYGGPSFLGVSALEWGAALAALVLAIAVRQAALIALRRYVRPVVEKTETEYDDRVLRALRRAVSFLVLLAGVFLAFSAVKHGLPESWQASILRVLDTLIIISVGFLIYRIAEIFLHHISHAPDEKRRSLLDQQFFPLLRDAAKFIVVVLVIVAVVQSWGYSATGILAGVGIGGLALAFAAQDTVANVFGSFVIYADRPYKVGDWVKIGAVEGTVEEVGIRSTRIRTFDKTLILVPNKVVANENVQNLTAMPLRRIKLYVGVTYDATTEQMQEAVARIRELLHAHPGVDQAYWLVNFTEMSSSSLDILVYCFVSTTVWQEYLDIRQDLLIKIIEIIRGLGMDIAFPTQTVYYKSADLPAALARANAEDALTGAVLPRASAVRERATPTGAGESPGAEHDVAEGEDN